MRQEKHALPAGLVAAAIAIAAAPANAAENSVPVLLQVQSKSWVKGSTFDANRFAESCAAAGVELTIDKSPTRRATAVVTYSETKGPGFSMFGVGEPAGYGTRIAFKLALLDGATARTLVTIAADAVTPNGLEVEHFHDGARNAFYESPAYRHACAAVAGALGTRAGALQLLPWALVSRDALAILDRIGFKPQNAAEEAYVAVAKRGFDGLASVEAAIEPLTLLFANSREPRSGIGTFPAEEPANAATLQRALRVLVSTDDERTVEALTAFLGDYAEYRSAAALDPEAVAVLRDVIRALGRIGSVFTLPLLEEWQGGSGSLAAEAGIAADQLRTKLTIRPQ